MPTFSTIAVLKTILICLIVSLSIYLLFISDLAQKAVNTYSKSNNCDLFCDPLTLIKHKQASIREFKIFFLCVKWDHYKITTVLLCFPPVTITGPEYRGVLLEARTLSSTNTLGSWQLPPPDTRFLEVTLRHFAHNLLTAVKMLGRDMFCVLRIYTAANL